MLIVIVIAAVLLFSTTLYWYKTMDLDGPVPVPVQSSLPLYCISKNLYRYTAAQDICRRLGGRLATAKEVQTEDGPSCGMGWCQGMRAYSHRNGNMSGGKLPGQLKLGVYCRGPKPKGALAKELGVL
jgi:hypothetical protein